MLQCVAVFYSVLQCDVVQLRCPSAPCTGSRSVLQCVATIATCCSVLQCVAVPHPVMGARQRPAQVVAVCCSVLQGVAVQSVAVCCRVLQCVAVCGSVRQCFAVCPSTPCTGRFSVFSVLQCVAVCCSVLQCVAVCCSVLQCVAACCSVLQRVAACCRVLQCVAVQYHVTDICQRLPQVICCDSSIERERAARANLL